MRIRGYDCRRYSGMMVETYSELLSPRRLEITYSMYPAIVHLGKGDHLAGYTTPLMPEEKTVLVSDDVFGNAGLECECDSWRRRCTAARISHRASNQMRCLCPLERIKQVEPTLQSDRHRARIRYSQSAVSPGADAKKLIGPCQTEAPCRYLATKPGKSGSESRFPHPANPARHSLHGDLVQRTADRLSQ